MRLLMFLIIILAFTFSFVSANVPVCEDGNGDVYWDGQTLGECLVCECDLVSCSWQIYDSLRNPLEDLECHKCDVVYNGIVPTDSSVSCFAGDGITDETYCVDDTNYVCGRSDTCNVVGYNGLCSHGTVSGFDPMIHNEDMACLDACYSNARIYSDGSCFSEDDDGDLAFSNVYCDATGGVPSANKKDRDDDSDYCHAATNGCSALLWGAYGESSLIGATDYIRFQGSSPFNDLQCCGDDENEFASNSDYAQRAAVAGRFPDGAACCSAANRCFGPLETNTLQEQDNYDNWECHLSGPSGTGVEVCQWYDVYPNRIYYDADCDGLLPSVDIDDCGATISGYVYSVRRSVGTLVPINGATVHQEGTTASTITDSNGHYELTVYPTDPNSNATRIIANYSGLVPDIFETFISFNADIHYNFTLYDRDCQSDCSNNGICDRTCDGENGCDFEDSVDILGVPAEDITDPGIGIGFTSYGLRYYLGASGDTCKYLVSCDGDVENVKCEELQPTINADNLGILQIGAQQNNKRIDAYIATW